MFIYVYVWRIVVKFQKRDAAHNNIACILYIPNEMHTLLTNFTVTRLLHSSAVLLRFVAQRTAYVFIFGCFTFGFLKFFFLE